MKFTRGYWLTRPGVHIYAARQVYRVERGPGRVTLMVPCRPIRHLGDTLGGPVLAVEMDSPALGVVRVRIRHFKGDRARWPWFSLGESPSEAEIREDDHTLEFQSDQLIVAIQKEPWRMEFRHGAQLLGSDTPTGVAYASVHEAPFMRVQLSLGVGERIYGLGERFTPLVRNGQSVDIWNEDGGANTDQAYKNIPFFISSRGYGIFVNDPGRVSFEIESEIVSVVQFSVPGESIEFLIIDGPTPKEVLQRYTALTGRPALPPAWSFGLWLSTSFATDYNEQLIEEWTRKLQLYGVPVHVLHFDCFWMKPFEWCSFEWDEEKFPHPEAMLSRLQQLGYHVSVWINPYVSQFAPAFDEGVRHRHFIAKADGSVWQTDHWQPGMAVVDFTNPSAVAWFQEQLTRLCRMGVAAFKTDFGERIPSDDVRYYDDSDPERMHNYYPYLYNRVVYEVVTREREGDGLVFARSATVGCQQFPVHWGGDNFASYQSMQSTLRGGLSLGLGGFGFWSHDIGGFEDTATADLYKRWVAFGLLSSHSRLHASHAYRLPWLYDEEAVEVLKHFVHLKCRLMPYLYAKAVEATQTGVPMLRAMMLEFPEDPNVGHLETQYMLGDRLLVAPVFNAAGEVTCYLPAGRWTHWQTHEQVEGGRWVDARYDYFHVGLYVRPHSLIPEGAVEDRPDYDYGEGTMFHLFEPTPGVPVRADLFDLRGTWKGSVEALWDNGQLTVQQRGSVRGWQLLWHHAPRHVEALHGTVTRTSEGVRCTPGADGTTILLKASL
ncbi:MAG: alpha-xylosidase [Firmicutes bacterium]|nr:alpha-xylosidase [Bacillota bacterium]